MGDGDDVDVDVDVDVDGEISWGSFAEETRTDVCPQSETGYCPMISDRLLSVSLNSEVITINHLINIDIDININILPVLQT